MIASHGGDERHIVTDKKLSCELWSPFLLVQTGAVTGSAGVSDGLRGL